MGESFWLNTTEVIHPDMEKPCKVLQYCPYDQLVEEFPFSDDGKRCPIFGHDCPVHYHAEIGIMFERASITEKG